MIRVNTRRIIAPMANEHPVGDFSKMVHPGKSVCADRLAVELEVSVSSRFGSGPNIAIIQKYHLVPKSFHLDGITHGGW